MLKKMQFMLAAAMLAFTAESMAMNHDLSPGTSIDYVLEINKPEIITNISFTTVKGRCKMTARQKGINSSTPSSTIHIVGLYRTVEVNGKKLKEHDEMSIQVNDGDSIYITAPPVAKVSLTNQGPYVLAAFCETL